MRGRGGREAASLVVQDRGGREAASLVVRPGPGSRILECPVSRMPGISRVPGIPGYSSRAIPES